MSQLINSFFDINANIGCGALEKTDFPDTEDLLSHMNRLNIDRSIVWHYQARDLNPMYGNKKLLSEINKTREARKCLIPALTISPPMLYEKGVLSELKEIMETDKYRALRVFPEISRFTLKQIEPVLKELIDYEPVLLIDSKEKHNPENIIALADKFPKLSIVYLQGMWTDQLTMIDMITRKENIFLDISWLHVREGIELIVDNFGAERLLFGTGPKAHNGASIAALAQANIDPHQKELIAHKNLEKLLNLETINTNKLSNETKDKSIKKPLWSKLSRNQKLDQINIIDAHGHLGPQGTGWVIRNQSISDQITDLLPQMNKLGIEKVIVSGEHALFGPTVEGNKILENEVQNYKNFFQGYLAFNPLYKEELETNFDDFFSRDFFIGFKLLCDYWKIPVTDSRFQSVWEYANEQKLPILLHTWDTVYDSPEMLSEIVKRYPEAIFILGHSGGGDKGRRQAEKLVINNDNVYLEWCGSFTSTILWEDTIARVGTAKIIFGSDTYFHNPAWELGRVLSLDISEKELKPILKNNIEEILAKRK